MIIRIQTTAVIPPRFLSLNKVVIHKYLIFIPIIWCTYIHHLFGIIKSCQTNEIATWDDNAVTMDSKKNTSMCIWENPWKY